MQASQNKSTPIDPVGRIPTRRAGRQTSLVVPRLITVCLLAVPFVASPAKAQAVAPSITLPVPDQVVQGQITITGTTGAANFASAELAFSYPSDTSNTWFLIEALAQPVSDGPLATWDTTKVTDGAYVMRLRVYATDGTLGEATVPFAIANYTVPVSQSPTPAPSSAPVVVIPTPLLIAASVTPEPAPAPTPTPLPPNPAAISTGLVYGGLGRGALIALAVVLLFGWIVLRRRS